MLDSYQNLKLINLLFNFNSTRLLHGNQTFFDQKDVSSFLNIDCTDGTNMLPSELESASNYNCFFF